MKTYEFVISIFLLLGCGSPREVSSSLKDTQLPGVPGEVPMLGMGFDPVAGKLTGLRCIEGATLTSQQARTATVTVEKDLGYEDLLRLMAGKIGISAPVYPGINANGSASFASEYSKTAYSETFTVALAASAGSKRLTVPDPAAADVQLSAPVQRVQAASEGTPAADLQRQYRDMCGTEYVSAAEFGMAMVAVLKVEYANEYDKKAFGGSVGVDVLGGIASGSLDIGVENLKASARARTSLVIHQRGGDPLDLLKVVDAAGSKPEIDPETGAQHESDGAFFLQCDFANRRHCIEVFKAVLAHTKLVSAAINDDAGGYEIRHAIPLGFETTSYPRIGRLKEISVDGPWPVDAEELKNIADTLSRLRERLIRVKGQAIADQARVDSLRAKLGVEGGQMRASLAAIETAANAAEKAANDAQAICDQAAAYIKVSDTAPCQQATVEAESALAYDRRGLSVMPTRFYSWCILAHSDMLINVEDKLAAKALMRLVGEELAVVTPGQADGAEVLSAKCLIAESLLAQLSSLVLDYIEDDPVHGIPLASLRVIASLDNLRSVSARHQFLAVTDGLRDLRQLETVDLTGNYFQSLSAFRGWSSTTLSTLTLASNQLTSLFDAADQAQTPLVWRTIDLSDNRIGLVEVDQRLVAPALQYLDLSQNEMTDASGLSGLTGLTNLNLRSTGIQTCPLANVALCDLGI